MKVTLKTTGQTLSITDKNYVASGGEGDVFAKDGIVYKIANNKKIILSEGKFNELSVLAQNPNIVAPLDLLYNGKSLVGYTMRFVKDAVPICTTFTNSWRNKNKKFTNDTAINLLKSWARDIDFVHKNNILIVDVNELNFLLNDDFKNLNFIDVNSYQTRSYPATAIMDSIRNRHVGNNFTYLTDWYSWGILAFMTLVGIHPFKGNHPTHTTLDLRMKANHSILKGGVKYPVNATRPLSVIPQGLKDWFECVFDRGVLVKPPMDFSGGTIIVAPKNTIKTLKSVYLNLEPVNFSPPEHEFDNGKIKANVRIISDKLHYKLERDNIWKETIIGANKMMSFNGRVFFLNSYGESLFEFELEQTNQKVIAFSKIICPILGSASKMFDGLVVEKLYKAAHVTVFPTHNKFLTKRLKELEEYREIVNAKYVGGFAIFICMDVKGKYDRLVYTFGDNGAYLVDRNADLDMTEISMCVLDKGIMIYIRSDNHITIRSKNTQQTIFDETIDTHWQLYNQGDKVIMTADYGQTYYKVSMI